MKRAIYSIPVALLLLPWSGLSMLLWYGLFIKPLPALLGLAGTSAVMTLAYEAHRRLSRHDRHFSAAICTSLVLAVPLVMIVKVFGQTVEPKYSGCGSHEVVTEVNF